MGQSKHISKNQLCFRYQSCLISRTTSAIPQFIYIIHVHVYRVACHDKACQDIAIVYRVELTCKSAIEKVVRIVQGHFIGGFERHTCISPYDLKPFGFQQSPRSFLDCASIFYSSIQTSIPAPIRYSRNRKIIWGVKGRAQTNRLGDGAISKDIIRQKAVVDIHLYV